MQAMELSGTTAPEDVKQLSKEFKEGLKAVSIQACRCCGTATHFVTLWKSNRTTVPLLLAFVCLLVGLFVGYYHFFVLLYYTNLWSFIFDMQPYNPWVERFI